MKGKNTLLLTDAIVGLGKLCGELLAKIHLAFVHWLAEHLCACGGQEGTAARVFSIALLFLMQIVAFLWLFDRFFEDMATFDDADWSEDSRMDECDPAAPLEVVAEASADRYADFSTCGLCKKASPANSSYDEEHREAFYNGTEFRIAPLSSRPSAWSLHIVLLDSDCVPVTLFEVEDLWQEAQRLQHSGFQVRFPPAVVLGV